VSAKAARPISLARTGSPNGDSWPKWMQRDQKYRGKKLMWITFSSRRAYGLRADAGRTPGVDGRFRSGGRREGKDASFAAFWSRSGADERNNIAQWVTHVARQGCTSSTQCDGTESCIDSVCRPTVN